MLGIPHVDQAREKIIMIKAQECSIKYHQMLNEVDKLYGPDEVMIFHKKFLQLIAIHKTGRNNDRR